MSRHRHGYHDVDPSMLTEASVVLTPEQQRLAVRAIAGSPMVANGSELSEVLAMLGLEAEDGRNE